MSDHQRAGRLDQRTAERLLGGAPAAPGDGHDALRALLSAAAGPARPGELHGEDAAAAAFRAVQARPAPRRSRWAALPRYATVKVAVVAVTLAAFGGGVAVAASTGHLPGRSPSPSSSHHHRSPGKTSHREHRPAPPPSSPVPHTSPVQRPTPSKSPEGRRKHGKAHPPGLDKGNPQKGKKAHPDRGDQHDDSAQTHKDGGHGEFNFKAPNVTKPDGGNANGGKPDAGKPNGAKPKGGTAPQGRDAGRRSGGR
ncbi:hypothetical protein [Actinomadura violacea]|uniref:Translation initiation factor IF-2 n=1 Tax=Actinomadura violacea TaxID=2819934 RepID=A0ABS3S6K3_9ACTN|nr:hypothetical protein [Actinomadura violacea]MBO2464640.1 hypothetical protein [Actinomadura violacea]